MKVFEQDASPKSNMAKQPRPTSVTCIDSCCTLSWMLFFFCVSMFRRAKLLFICGVP